MIHPKNGRSVIRRPSFNHSSSGFTLIEVMIALLVLGVGLLGFALLQTMNVRFTKSAQQRTIASNLAYEIIDIMRTQRSMGSHFNGITFASFPSTDPTAACVRAADATASANIDRWKCEVATALPEGKGQVELQANGRLKVTIVWGDAHWATNQGDQATSFEVFSRI